MASLTTPPHAELPESESLPARVPLERASLLETVCDAYVELGRLAVIAVLLGVTSFIVTYVVKNQALTENLRAEPLQLEHAAR